MEAGVGRGAGAGQRGLLLVFALVLLIRLPFLNQAVQGDDHIYLTEAAHALVDPLHPAHTHYTFMGDVVDLRGHSHPPLNALALAALLAVFGDVKEVPFHAFYALFSLIAAWAMWSLARRYSPQPVWATLLFVAVPAFVVNGGSLESDLPFLAFWMAAIALFVGQRSAARLALSAVCMALAAMTAYQGVFLIPILGVYVWLNHRADRARWALLLVPALTLAAWQLFERATTGAAPAGQLMGYFATYGFQAAQKKLASALMLFIHGWFMVFPALVPAAFLLAWRKRAEKDTQFLLWWIALFYAGAAVVFFAGSARYLLPMAAPLALLASRLRMRWLALGFAAQLALGLGMAAVNYEHWDGYRQFAARLRPAAAGHRVWVDAEWGLRQYLEADGALALSKLEHPKPGDIVVTSALGHSVDVMAPKTPLLKTEITSAIPLRLIGLNTRSGYSSVGAAFYPFGASNGVIDRVSAELIQERHPTLEYLPMDAPEAGEQAVSGVFSLEGQSRWVSKTAVFALKTPAEAMPLRAVFYVSPNALARRAVLRLDGKEVAARTWSASGRYEVVSAPARGSGETAMVEFEVDRAFTAPNDSRELGVVMLSVGFARQ
jgi:hypothetical protein